MADHWHGTGTSLHDAAEEAADKALKEKGDGTYKLVTISVHVAADPSGTGPNPIHDYSVVLGPG
jgi:hypothetical protein